MFYQSRRLDNVARLLGDMFIMHHFETTTTGLRLVTDPNAVDDRPSSMLKVKTDHWSYIISTSVDFNDDEETAESSATVENPSELKKPFLTLPLASNICFSDGYAYESDLADIIYKLFFDLRYGNSMEEREINNFPYLLPLVSAYHSHHIEDHFLLAHKKGEEDGGLYLLDDKIPFEVFQVLAMSELEWLFSALRTHLDQYYEDEYVLEWQELAHADGVIEYFISIEKYLDKNTAERLAEYVGDEENYEKLMALTHTRPSPVAKLGVTFTNNVVIISAPNRYIEDGVTEIDMSNMVSSFLIARNGLLPKDYALLSIQNCVADLFSCVVQVIIRDSDIDSIEDISDLLF